MRPLHQPTVAHTLVCKINVNFKPCELIYFYVTKVQKEMLFTKVKCPRTEILLVILIYRIYLPFISG